MTSPRSVAPAKVLTVRLAAFVVATLVACPGCEALLGVDFDRVHVVAGGETPDAGSSPGSSGGPSDDGDGGDAACVGPCAEGGLPPDPACASPHACADAEELPGPILGDVAYGSAHAEGATSRWFRVRLQESAYAFNGAMRVSAELTSPPGTNFDLTVFMNKGADVVECGVVAGRSSAPSGLDRVVVTWGTDTPAGADDSRWVTLEVRHVSGACDGTPWSLVVKGGP